MIIICEVYVVIIIVGGCIRIVLIDQRRFRLDVMPNILPIFVDNVIGMLEMSRSWLTMLHLIKLLLRLL